MSIISKIKGAAKAAKLWITANKLAAGIAAGVLVVGGGAAVALGAGFLPQQTAAETTEAVISSDLSTEELAAAYEANLLRGEQMGQPLLDAMWESLEQEYARETTTEEETTEEETEAEKEELPEVEIPPVVVAPINDEEDEQPQDDGDKGTSDEIDISDVVDNGNYENVGVSYGIDVSKWQGSIDWSKVAESGVEFAIIRVGYRGNTTGEIVMDPYFERNIKGALANNIKVGVYFYSQAINEEEALVEAAWVVNVISKYQITYPVVYDCEGLGQNRIKDVTKTQRSKNAGAFLDYIRKAGYTPMMYASKYGYNNNWDLSYITNCKYWLAHYTSGGLSTPSDYAGTYHMWQYTSKGSVPGIRGNVDMNIAYFSYSNTPDPVIGTVSYTVKDESGSPVSGATVTMKGSASRKTLTAVTDSNGTASFTDVVVDDYAVSVSGVPDGYATVAESQTSVSFGKAEASYSGSLQLKRVASSSVRYYVVDQEGSPVQGATVTLSGNAKVGAAVNMTATTNASGLAEFKNIPLGTYEVYASGAPEGYSLPATTTKETANITSSDPYTGSQKIVINKDEKPTETETATEPSTTNPAETTSSAETTSPTESVSEGTTSGETTVPDSSETSPETSQPAESSSAASDPTQSLENGTDPGNTP